MGRQKRLIVCSAVLVASLFLVSAVQHWPIRSDMNRAQREYAEAHHALVETTERRDALEEQMRLLQTRVDSVETRARLEYRLIRPGERLLIVREQHLAE